MDEIIKFVRFLIVLFIVIFVGLILAKLAMGAIIVLSVIFFAALKIFIALMIVAAIGAFLISLI